MFISDSDNLPVNCIEMISSKKKGVTLAMYVMQDAAFTGQNLDLNYVMKAAFEHN